MGSRGFPIGLHTKHSRLLVGWLVGQVYADGGNIRSSVFVWVEQYTHLLPCTHTLETHTVHSRVCTYLPSSIQNYWNDSLFKNAYMPVCAGMESCFYYQNCKGPFMERLKCTTHSNVFITLLMFIFRRLTETLNCTITSCSNLNLNSIQVESKPSQTPNKLSDAQSPCNRVFFSYQHHMMFVLLSKVWRGGETEREREKSYCAGDGNFTACFSFIGCLLSSFLNRVSARKDCMQEQKA